jgi:endonuclease/exonuclease/phosphatase family metal-dependent hydrolase
MLLAIATFNLENLFTRYARLDDPLAENTSRVIMTGVTSIDYQGNPLSRATTGLQRNNTARSILDGAPDILAIQEVENLCPFANAKEGWTHYYVAGNEISRLDYILVDKSLSVASTSILRHGITLKCALAGERYPTVGYVDSEASDHCPVTVTLNLP